MRLLLAINKRHWEEKEEEFQNNGFNCEVFRSQNHGIIKLLGLEGTSGDCLYQPSAKAGSPGASDTEMCPGVFWMSPQRETAQLPWAAASSARHPQCKEFLPLVEMKLLLI